MLLYSFFYIIIHHTFVCRFIIYHSFSNCSTCIIFNRSTIKVLFNRGWPCVCVCVVWWTLLCYRCVIVVLLLCYCRVIVMLLLHCCCVVVVLLLCCCCAIVVLLLCYCCYLHPVMQSVAPRVRRDWRAHNNAALYAAYERHRSGGGYRGEQAGRSYHITLAA